MYDETYKRVFGFPRMVEDLLRGCVAGPWIDEIDFSTLRKLPAEYVSDELLTRHGDAVWRARLGDGWVHLLVLIEFQSRDEPRMALRILTYTGLLYQELVRNGAVAADEPLPPVLPVVLYNGAPPWRAVRDVGDLIAPAGPALSPYQPAQRYAVVDERRVREDDLPVGNLMTAVVRLENSRSPEDLLRTVDALRGRLDGPDDEGLRAAFVDWLRRVAEQVTPRGAALPPVQTLEELRMTVVERAAEWPRQWFQEGMEQGIEQGFARGLVHERALLRRQAASRFGEDTAERLAEVLARIGEPERLAEAGERLVRCDSGAELLAEVAGMADEGDGTGA